MTAVEVHHRVDGAPDAPPVLMINSLGADLSTGGTGAVADAVVARWLTPAYAAAHPERVAALRAMVAATPTEGYAAACSAIEVMDQRPDLPRIAAPTLVLAGADDPATPPPHAELIARAIPGARLAILDHAAHLATYERADAATPLILKAL
ncbi:alpha/beta fold hydrolase [Rhizomonospora bruguierae]|uniref:alpha/beta fold hydrolase n=1 Tax=Rhizomonospora bruguierae TaxID=1581705 RepID=UPI001BCCCC37|nr:alpha/beta fold hydrolase [Micromonospora sp. NBRC 107566]